MKYINLALILAGVAAFGHPLAAQRRVNVALLNGVRAAPESRTQIAQFNTAAEIPALTPASTALWPASSDPAQPASREAVLSPPRETVPPTPTAGTENPRVTPIRPQTTEEVQARLAGTVLSANYVEQNLEQVLNDLRAKLNLNMVVYWPKIEAAGIRRDNPVTLQLQNVSARSVLDRALKIGAGNGLERLGFAVRDGIVEVDLASSINRYFTRTYYIADLIQRRNDFSNNQGGGNSFGGGSNAYNSNSLNSSGMNFNSGNQNSYNNGNYITNQSNNNLGLLPQGIR